MPAASRPRRPTARRRKLLWSLVPLLALLLAAELTMRLVRAPLHFGSFRTLRVDMMQRGYPAVRDDLLGYVPRPNFASSDNHWGTRVTIDAEGLRAHPRTAPRDRQPIVAVGDSFTFGDEVDDDATWPARLELLAQRPVLNGGVFGYSFGQAVLRAEQLLLRHRAEWLVVSFIAGGMERCELGKRYAPVPWFAVVDGRLELRNVPVQDTSDPGEQEERWLKDLLGRSALVDGLCAHAFPQWWILDQKEVRVLPRGAAVEVCQLLVERIAAFCRERRCRLLLVLQGERPHPWATAVLQHARGHGMATLDLVAELAAQARRDPDVVQRWFDGHMTAAGNHWTAAHIAAALQQAR